ncbi:MAG: hypothetical protein, partial [Olavius algarvensis Gamma 1 endosymbiont]
AKLRLIADCAGYAITQESLTIPLLDHFRNYHYQTRKEEWGSFSCLSCFPWTLSSLFVSAFVVPDSCDSSSRSFLFVASCLCVRFDKGYHKDPSAHLIAAFFLTRSHKEGRFVFIENPRDTGFHLRHIPFGCSLRAGRITNQHEDFSSLVHGRHGKIRKGEGCSFPCLPCLPWTLSSLFVSAFVVSSSRDS